MNKLSTQYNLFIMDINLSHKVKELCREKGITMKELAEKMKIAPESLSRAINGNPQLSTLKNIADSLNVSLCDLLGKVNQSDIIALVVYQGVPKTFDNLENLWNYIYLIKKKQART